MEHFTNALKQYADFSGRATREQYWMFILFYFIITIGVSIVDEIFGIALFSTIYILAMFVPSISAAARRLHDTGRSGWWQLIAIIPLIGFIVLIVFLVEDSHADNEYGPNPKSASPEASS